MEKYFFILGQPFTKQSVYRFLALVITVIALIAGGSYYVYLREFAPTQNAEAGSRTYILVEPSDIMFNPESLSDIMKAHMNATGFGELRDFSSSGNLKNENEITRTIKIKGCYPNYYKLTIDYKENQHTADFGYNAAESWIEMSWAKESFQNDATNVNIVLVLSSLPHLAWSYRFEKESTTGNASVLELMPMQQQNGRDCYVVRSRGLLPLEIDHYIDSHSFHEVFRIASLKKPDGSNILLEVDYDQSNRHEKSQLPSFYSVYQNGELQDEVDLKSVQMNIIIPKILFEPPSD